MPPGIDISWGSQGLVPQAARAISNRLEVRDNKYLLLRLGAVYTGSRGLDPPDRGGGGGGGALGLDTSLTTRDLTEKSSTLQMLMDAVSELRYILIFMNQTAIDARAQ